MRMRGELERLEELLSESREEAAERERSEFDRLTGNAPGLVLFGAGNMGRTVVPKLRSAGVKVRAFCDNNRELWGECLEGVPVLSPKDAADQYGADAAFVITIWGVGAKDRMVARVRQLQSLGCRNVLPFPPLFWKYPDLFLPHNAIDRPTKVLAEALAVRTAYGFWADDFSRREYVAQVNWRLRGGFDEMADPVPETTYFPGDVFALTEREVFIDCGAYDGDTVSSFLKVTGGRFERIVAFEPDPLNCAKLRNGVAALPGELAERIEIRQQATGRSNSLVSFAVTGGEGSAMGTGDFCVECVKLDSALDGVVPTIIKLDIEGAEIEAIEGAREVIGRSMPVLAVCSYHRQSDLWRIPCLIHSICPDYRLYLRPHRMEGWDSVCYAVPPHRRPA